MIEIKPWGASVDSAGMFGLPHTWKKLWQEAIAIAPQGFKGFEACAWFHPWLADWTFHQAEARGLNIIRIHSVTGGIHEARSWMGRLIMASLNACMVKPEKTIQRYGKKQGGVLIHAPALEDDNLLEFISQNSHLLNRISIENHSHIGGGGKALEVAVITKQLFEDALAESSPQEESKYPEIEIVFDLCHAWKRSKDHGNINSRWSAILHRLAMVLGVAKDEGLRVGIHGPVGERDGLPAAFAGGDNAVPLWRGLSEVYYDAAYDNVRTLFLIEKQNGGLAECIWLPPWEISYVAGQICRTVDILREAELIN